METTEETIIDLLQRQKSFFLTGKTRGVEYRLEKLKLLRSTILRFESKILEALYKDLRKSPEEGLITEIGLVIKELDYHIKKVRKWSKAKKVKTPLYLLPSSSYLLHEPLGNVLIIAPWNYPFLLLMNPLVGAVSAGNCAILKPSEFCIYTNAVMNEIVGEVFDQQHIALVQGGKETNQALLVQKFDKIFFTGSPRLGKIVMQAAAETLTPVVLELGGKSPCIVDESANIDVAAKRIAWGKLVNLGQTCIAPDYLLAHRSVKEDLERKIIENWKSTFGEDPQKSPFLTRMITHEAFDRVSSYLKQGNIIYGGQVDREDKYISPTLLESVDQQSDIMQDEIFGPILPIIAFDKIEEAIQLINSKTKPLAYYYFGNDRDSRKMLEANTSGGACINDTLIHISNHSLPFGGIGTSGMGRYHGRYSFEAFSNSRSIMKSPTWIDLPFRYPPFKHFKWIKKLLT